MNYRTRNISLSKKELFIHKANHPQVVSDFISSVKILLDNNTKNIRLRINKTSANFPNVIVPISAYIHYLSNQIEFEFHEIPDYLLHAGFGNPLIVSDNLSRLEKNTIDAIWAFSSSDEIFLLANHFVEDISQEIVYEKGIKQALMWCLYEVMDNVLNHSQASYGFIMGQLHRNKKYMAFCIADSGKGIYNTLKGTTYKPESPLDALELCLQQGVTRGVGQGNGLWGFSNIIKNNKGIFNITSNSANIKVSENDMYRLENLPVLSEENGGTIIDFQINYENPIIIEDMLGGYIPVDIDLEKMETDSGYIHFVLSEKNSGVGTRSSGLKIRTELINIHNDSKKAVILDFSGLEVISSSFADELLGKLVVHYGFFAFNKIFRLEGMNKTIQAIVQRSVAQRMASSFNNEIIDESE